MQTVILFFLIFLISCGGDDEVTDLGRTGSGKCVNCKKTTPPPPNNTNPENNTTDQANDTSTLNTCNDPLTIETFKCVRFNTTETGTFYYITASTEKEKNDCIKKYSILMQGCTDKFIAKWPLYKINSLCISAKGICSNVKIAWENKMKQYYTCSSTTELIDEKSMYKDVLSPDNTPPDCSEINSFEPFIK